MHKDSSKKIEKVILVKNFILWIWYASKELRDPGFSRNVKLYILLHIMKKKKGHPNSVNTIFREPTYLNIDLDFIQCRHLLLDSIAVESTIGY